MAKLQRNLCQWLFYKNAELNSSFRQSPRRTNVRRHNRSQSLVHLSVGDHFPISTVTFLIKSLEERTRKSEVRTMSVQHSQQSRELHQYFSNKTKSLTCARYYRPNKVILSQSLFPDTITVLMICGKFHLFPGLGRFDEIPKTRLEYRDRVFLTRSTVVSQQTNL